MKISLGALLVSIVPCFTLIACGDKKSPDTDLAAPASTEDTLARERVAAHFRGNRLPQARTALAPLLAGSTPALEDLVRAAAIELADSRLDALAPILERGLARAAAHPALRYMRAQLALQTGQLEAALADLQVARAGAPGDLPTALHLAAALYDLGRGPEAESLYLEIMEVGIEHGGSWYISALYRLSRIQLEEGRGAQAAPLLKELRNLEERGLAAPASVLLTRGNLGWVEPPPVRDGAAPVARELPAYTSTAIELPQLAGARQLVVRDLDGDRRPDLVAGGGAVGLAVARRGRAEPGGPGQWEALTLAPPGVSLARAFDLGNDDDLDFILARGGELSLLIADGFSWTPSRLTFARLPDAPRDIAPVDFDHDGDLDLLLAGPFGARLLRNDGAATVDRKTVEDHAGGETPGGDGPGGEDSGGTGAGDSEAPAAGQAGGFTDVTAEAGLPTGRPFNWCVIEDFDGDQDVDLLLGGPAGLFLADNQRAGQFADGARLLGELNFGSENTTLGPWLVNEPVVAALGARPLAALAIARAEGGAPLLWRRVPGSGGAAFTRDGVLPAGTGQPAPWSLLADINLDGTGDLVHGDGQGAVRVDTDPGRVGGTGAQLCAALGRGAPLVFADLDGDLDLDGLRPTQTGCELLICTESAGRGARLEYLGLKDNKRAVGAVVEVRAGPAYRRIFWDGNATVVGVGDREWVDVVRVTWPNGVVQTELDLELSSQTFVDDTGELLGPFTQAAGLVGSCPFLYAWNGEAYTFISDVLGITPLGLPMAPGLLVPPDHDEFVLVTGEQLKERDGELRLQFTEELREVTYLDRVRLDVIDHPADTAIYPDERFTFPPFPAPHTHSVRAPLAPSSALGSDGRDWSAELSTADDVHAVPFTNQAPQFLGLATPHTLDLTFDGQAIAGATKLRLVFTGWFFWSDASVNMAAARTPGVDFVPPILSVPVPGGQGAEAWRPLGPPVGFPAGKTKSMVIDVSGQIDPADPRIRVFSTLRLYWDRIVLAVDDDDAELRVVALEPQSADLWRRGFSEPSAAERDDLPERFDWERLAPQPRWNQHPGDYTRYGDTLELVTAIDDRFVIMGAGDALTLVFDATALTPLAAGWRRDYLLFLDGWAKDRDPNSVEALFVEPLPHHAMPGYPYGPDTPFPEDAQHRTWRAEFNTRPAHNWIGSVAPAE